MLPDLVDIPCLKELHLNNNKMGNNGTRSLALCLQFCRDLQSLSLASNGISDVGVKALAANIHHCTQLQTLVLQENDVDEHTAQIIVLSLKQCKMFKALSLSHKKCRHFAKNVKQLKRHTGDMTVCDFNIHFKCDHPSLRNICTQSQVLEALFNTYKKSFVK